MIGQATEALLTAVWQGSLLVAVVWLGLRMLPKTPAGVRFAIWFGVFLVVTALPLATLWPHAATALQGGGRGAWLTLDMRWSVAIAVVWFAVSLVRGVRLVVAAARVRALWKRATPVKLSGEVSPRSTASNMGHPDALMSRRAELCVSDEVDRPTVIGFFAPKILIPTWLLEKLTASELEQVVLHETGHLGRADDWMNLLQKIALVIFPLNPALSWVERRLCFERELAVDERVLRALAGRTGATTAYASCLATVAEHRLGRRGLALALGVLGRESELAKRVSRILRHGEVMRPVQARFVLGGALMGLLAVSAGLERCPELVGFAAHEAMVARAIPAMGQRAQVSTMSFRSKRMMEKVNSPHEVLAIARMGGAAGTVQRAGISRALQVRSADVAGVDSWKSSRRNESGIRSVPGVEIHPASSRLARKTDVVARVPQSNPDFAARSDQQVAGGMAWVVVTEWQGADGLARTSRMVLTTAVSGAPARPAQRVQTDMAPVPEQNSEQVFPYAAVPVRGGWLVFQL